MSDHRREARALRRAGYTIEDLIERRDSAKARGDRDAARGWDKMRLALACLEASERAAAARARRDDSKSEQVNLLGEE